MVGTACARRRGSPRHGRVVPIVLWTTVSLVLTGGLIAPSAEAGAGVGPARAAARAAAPVAANDPGGSARDRKRALDRQLSGLREDLEGTSDALVNAAVDLRGAQSDLVDARATLRTAQSAAQVAQAKDDALAAQLAVAQASLAKATRDLRTRQDQENQTKGRLGAIAREAYVGSRLTGLSIALNADSPAQFADRVSAAGTALRQQNGTLARLRVEQAETRARQSRLDATRAVVADLKKQSAAVLGQRRAAEAEATAATERIGGLVAKQQRAVATISARKAAEKRRLARLTAEQNALAALLRARARAAARAARHSGGSGSGSGSSFNGGSGRLSYPVNAPITSGFGLRYHPILHYWRLHAGTDFGAACGTPVHAAASGRIVRAGWAGGFGNQVVIDHGRIRGRSLASSYNHLSRIIVHHGSVRRGQLIAYSGTTGLSTGCHLHFEVYVNGTHVNPMTWL
jgi:murein DD-endopeptidase MepM/ murein hydrolase activator NlpD